MGERLTQEQLEGIPDKFEVDPAYHAQTTDVGTLMDDELLAHPGHSKEGKERESKAGRTLESK